MIRINLPRWIIGYRERSEIETDSNPVATTHRKAHASLNIGFWLIQIPGWLLVLYLVYAQAIPAFDYDLGVAMGTQESADVITGVGVAFWYGFAFGDLVTYIPLLAVGLAGYGYGAIWGRLLLSAALGITVYWPIVCLAAVVAARDADGWQIDNELPYWIVLPLIALWGIWGLWFLLRTAEGTR